MSTVLRRIIDGNGCVLWLNQDHDVVEFVIVSDCLFLVVDGRIVCASVRHQDLSLFLGSHHPYSHYLLSLFIVPALLAVDWVLLSLVMIGHRRPSRATSLQDVLQILLQAGRSGLHELLAWDEVLLLLLSCRGGQAEIVGRDAGAGG